MVLPTPDRRPITVADEVCRDFERSSGLEWIETNATGAFAMGTVAGVNTRRYHALLTASLRPPVERYVFLSRVEEEAALDGRRYELGAAQYPGVVAPRGFEYLREFRTEPCATWLYRLGEADLEKQVFLVEGRQEVILRYRASHSMTLRVRPFLAYRDYHSLAHANDSLRAEVERLPGAVRLAPYGGLPPLTFHFQGDFVEQPCWYYVNEYLRELDRGLDFREDLFTPGQIVLALEPGVWTAIRAGIEAQDDGGSREPPTQARDPFLVRRADGRPTIIAGYPWFTDWGRDTMISLPGLLIARGRLDEARQIIGGFLEARSQGIIPNRFPDAGETPEYNTVDATLWMFQAMRHWLAAGGDRGFLHDVFYPAAREIIEWHRRGTWFGIGVDPADGLLAAGVPGAQLTWMDAKVGDWVVTPRHGKPVEINALWHAALSLMAEWSHEISDGLFLACANEARRVRDSFRAQFWNPADECLNDVIASDGPDRSMRPNQIFAVSLGLDLLEADRQQAVVRAVERDLLTPVGLRTLAPGDPAYRPRYEGSPWERDGAYHQGTVWPWLLGPFIDAYLAAFGKTSETLDYCRGLAEALEDRSRSEGCLGSIAEIYDADEPRLPRGCPAQAWSVAELARVRWQHGM